ncbi:MULTISPECIES: hypothetical protein [Pseudobacillus]|uniref:hypothetical protein n=1 Tax=Pseudobacillus TaxID=108525 RepID=UPI00387972F3
MRRIYTTNAERFELVVGDPHYFGQLKKEILEKITLSKTYKNVVLYLVVSLETHKFDEEFYTVPTAKLLIIEKDNEYNEIGQPLFKLDNKGDIFSNTEEELQRKEIQLGCDSAQFNINDENILTGADGAYGDVIHFSFRGKPAADLITLDFPEHMAREEMFWTFYMVLKKQGLSLKEVKNK